MKEVCSDVSAWEKIIKNSLDIICTIDKDGYLVNINEACRRVLGYGIEEITGYHFRDFVHQEDLLETQLIIQEITKGYDTNSFEHRCISKSGKEISIFWSATWSEEDEVILAIGRDVTEQRSAQQKDELYQALVQHGSDILTLLDKKLNFLYAGTSTFKELGYQPEQLIGTNAFNYIHPDDISVIQEGLSKVMISEVPIKVSDYRFRDAKGRWRWMEVKASNQLDNPSINALVTISRDVTERVHNQLKLEESGQRYKSLFDHHINMVLFQDKEGLIQEVNPATLTFFGVQKQDVINRPFSDFLTPETAEICAKVLQQALNGERIRYEMAIPFPGKGCHILDISKIPVVVNAEIIGVYSILRDITEVSLYNDTIKQQAKKLNTIFESITDAFFTLDKNWNFTYVNSEFKRILNFKNSEQFIGKSLREIFPDELNGQFCKHYRQALETAKAVHFEAFMESLGIWLSVKAYPSEEGLSIYFEDITENIKSKQELEKLSLVASKTTNGVYIADAEGRVEWVNESFTLLTGYSYDEVIGIKLCSMLQGEDTDPDTASRIWESIHQGKPCTEEILNYKKTGEKIWLQLDITPLFNEQGELHRLIVIQNDITHRKEAENQQLQLTQDLFRQNRDLQQFNYIVSHNLRSPVARALGLADLLSVADKNSKEFDEYLTYLKTSVSQLDTVMNDLNMILSIPNQQGINEKIQLTLVNQQAISNLSESLKECEGEVITEIDECVFVKGNKAYLHSIFYNLLSNAIKYRSPKRKLKIRIKCHVTTEKGTIISFCDNGLGIDMKLAGSKIFTLYKRFHTRSEGRGIGLYLVKTHIEAMGGHIEVMSHVNVGTSFLIYLP